MNIPHEAKTINDFDQEIKEIFEQQLEASIKQQIEDAITNGIDYSNENINNHFDNVFSEINIPGINIQNLLGINTKKKSKDKYIKNIKLICDKFYQVALQLERKRGGLTIKNEYDVQDLFHSLLNLYFDDIRKEEYVGEFCGANSRVDFLLKPEQIFIEIKKTRANHSNKKLGEELIIDIDRYPNHPDCKTIVFFIYDPDRRIINPRGFENDFGNKTGNIDIKVFIRPE